MTNHGWLSTLRVNAVERQPIPDLNASRLQIKRRSLLAGDVILRTNVTGGFALQTRKDLIMCNRIMSFTLSVASPLPLLWACWLNQRMQHRVRCRWPHWQYLPTFRLPPRMVKLAKPLYPDLRERIAQIFTERFRQW